MHFIHYTFYNIIHYIRYNIIDFIMYNIIHFIIIIYICNDSLPGYYQNVNINPEMPVKISGLHSSLELLPGLFCAFGFNARSQFTLLNFCSLTAR
jgi:hypothetical protein